MKKTLFLLSIFAILFACKMANQSSPPTSSETCLVALQMHGCRGFCPQYVLTFHTTGRVEYEGIRNMEKMGNAAFQLSADELKRLHAAVTTTNVWQYPERIESQVADAPMSTITVFAEGKTKAVMGAVGRPKPLTELETLLKKLAKDHGVNLKSVSDTTPD